MSPVFRREDGFCSVLMINAQGIMLSVKGNDFFISYNKHPERYPLIMKRNPLDSF